jgi:hypothetical protein
MHESDATDTPEAKKAVFRRLVQLYALGDLDALEELMAPGYAGHVAAGDRDLDGFRQSIVHFHKLFIYERDSFAIEDQIVEGDKVATRMTARVRHRETGAPVTLIGINLAIIKGGKILEEWNTWEQLHRA